MGLMERGVEALERIATALENGASSGAVAATSDVGKTGKATSSKKSKPNEKVVGKPKETPAEDAPSKQAVREALQSLQQATTPAQAKSILKAHGASTLGNLDEVKYQQVIDACTDKMPD